MCVHLSPLCTPSLLRLQVALARVPFELPLVFLRVRCLFVDQFFVRVRCLTV